MRRGSRVVHPGGRQGLAKDAAVIGVIAATQGEELEEEIEELLGSSPF